MKRLFIIALFCASALCFSSAYAGQSNTIKLPKNFNYGNGRTNYPLFSNQKGQQPKKTNQTTIPNTRNDIPKVPVPAIRIAYKIIKLIIVALLGLFGFHKLKSNKDSSKQKK